MRLTGDDALKFDSFLPIYNWIYPISGKPSVDFVGKHAGDVFGKIGRARSRALYVHIPFCETICSFCPFVRAADHNNSIVNAYVNALVQEIELKGKVSSLTSTPIGAIFFGGGTPSLLEPQHILTIGRALRNSFDIGECKEFSFEFEVKSVSEDRISAAKEIGVTHARFGAQTFSPVYRKLFNLTASIDQVRHAAVLLKQYFPYVSCDLLYGMHGQSEEDLQNDLQAACDLGLLNLDFYPINNLVTQPRLHADYRDEEMLPTSGLTKFYMNLFVRAFLHEKGFLPHNGHGYVKVDSDELKSDPVVTDRYSFVYHEHTLGYPGYDLLGFGVNAVSSFDSYVISNSESREEYIHGLQQGHIRMQVSEHEPYIDACRAITLALPYHGSIQKDWVDWSLIPDDVRQRLDETIKHGLVTETDSTYLLTRYGWEWYSNLMYYLLPSRERAGINAIILNAVNDARRNIEISGLEGFYFEDRLANQHTGN